MTTIEFAIAVMRLAVDMRDGKPFVNLDDLWTRYASRVGRISSGKFLQRIADAINYGYLEPAISGSSGDFKGKIILSSKDIGLSSSLYWAAVFTEDAENQLRALNAENLLQTSGTVKEKVEAPPRTRSPEDADGTLNQVLQDAFVRNQIFMLRYAARLKQSAWDRLDELHDDIDALVAKSDLSFDTTDDVKAIALLRKKVTALNADAWNDITTATEDELTSFIEEHSVTLTEMFNMISPVETGIEPPSTEVMLAAMFGDLVEGRDFTDVMEAARKKHAASVLATITASANIGRSKEDTIAYLSRNLNSGKAAAEGIISTYVVHGSSVMTSEIFSEADFIKEQFTAVLDGRTTARCRSLDGNIYNVGEGPHPPLHFRCRSIRVPFLDGEAAAERTMTEATERQLLAEFTDKEGINVARSRSALPRGYRNAFDDFSRTRLIELIGPAPTDIDYETFLRRQTQEFQEDVLGVAKAKLFREGKLSLDKFVTADGDELTLEQLRKKYEALFKSLGM